MARQHQQYSDKWRTPLGGAPELAKVVSIKMDAETADEPAEPATIQVLASAKEFGTAVILGITVPGHYMPVELSPARARELWEALGVAMRYHNVRGVSFAVKEEEDTPPHGDLPLNELERQHRDLED